MYCALQYMQDMGQFGKAKETLEKAAKTEPDNSTVHFSLGCVCEVKVVCVW